MGIIDLLDFLKESDFVTMFTDAFTTVATRETTPREVIRKRLLLVLYALGTNIGIKRVADGGRHGETERRAARHPPPVRQPRQPALGNHDPGNATLRMRDPLWWGNGTACASDSKKFGSCSSNLMTEYHVRYGGHGVMIYWHVHRSVPGRIVALRPADVDLGPSPVRRWPDDGGTGKTAPTRVMTAIAAATVLP